MASLLKLYSSTVLLFIKFPSLSIYPYIFNMGLKFYDRIPFELYIRPQLSSYLDSVLGGLKWHMENNKPTPKNHFGTHKWFSK